MRDSAAQIASLVHDELAGRGLRLAVAESCTGGFISRMLTLRPGASAFFEFGLVCYSTESKIKLLGVDASLIIAHGAVSEQCARQMAICAMRLGGTDCALSVTGNLGPVPMEGKPAGLVYMAVAHKDEINSDARQFEGARDMIRSKAAVAALELLLEHVKEKK